MISTARSKFARTSTQGEMTLSPWESPSFLTREQAPEISFFKKDDAETSVLFELIADRYESSSLIITSNQAFGDWDQIFPDNVMAVAAIDRLVHHATIINIEDQSYRKRTAKSNKNSKPK